MMMCSTSLFLCLGLVGFMCFMQQRYKQINIAVETLDRPASSQRLDYAGQGFRNGAKVFCLYDLEESELSDLGVSCSP